MKKILKTISIASVVVVILIIGFYIINFYEYKISEDPTIWGAFGDYIGGTVNTVISLSSLIILACLTYQLSKDESQQNKEVALLLRRIEVYDSISAFLSDIKRNKINLFQDINSIENDLTRNPPLNLDHHTREINDFFQFYDNMYYMINSLKLKYNHIFEYDFESNDFISLKNSIGGVHMDIHNIFLRSKNRAFPFPKIHEKEIFYNQLEVFYTRMLIELQKELLK
ncbi:hypothetical protein ACHRVW_08445 [Flavobacterium collinsii]|uniref:hypothetical protein n=1 Tax=Flavobacterium collinsii TaxID=1114861 RepID=UPI0037582EF0